MTRRERPEKTGVVAQAAIVTVQFDVELPGEPVQPTAMGLVAILPKGPYACSGLVPADQAGPVQLLEAIQSVEERHGIVPGVVRVRDGNLVEELGRRLGPATTVELVDALPELDEAAASLAEMANHARLDLPSPLVVPDVNEADLRAFAEAALRFWEAAPWRRIDTSYDILILDAPRPDPALRAVSVVGSADDECGLILLADPDDFEVLADDDHDFTEDRAMWSVWFHNELQAPVSEIEVWVEMGLPWCGHTIPMAYCLGPGPRVRRASRRLLAFFSALMDTLSTTTEEELDSGRWSKTVETRVGRQTVALTLPSVLAMNRPRSVEKAVNPLHMERLTRDIGRLLAEQSFASIDEANTFLQREVMGKPLVAPQPTTKVEKAQDLATRALESGGRVRSILARRALALDPDCSDGYLAFAYAAPSDEDACPHLEQAVAAGERSLGPDMFAEQAGSFWSLPETRPYMRACLELADVLWNLGRTEEAIAHYRELLRLDPNDHQGVRDILVPALLAENDLATAEEILKRYGEKGTAFHDYNLALLRFAQEDDSSRARRALSEALASNHLVAELLLDGEPHGHPTAYVPGSIEEAQVYANQAGEAWETVPGAMDWLADRLASTPERRRPRRKPLAGTPIPF